VSAANTDRPNASESGDDGARGRSPREKQRAANTDRWRACHYSRAMSSIREVSTEAEYAAVRRLFGAYQRAVESMANDAEICP
jgi:hypothetical protein